jgi:hypothetical protein
VAKAKQISDPAAESLAEARVPPSPAGLASASKPARAVIELVAPPRPGLKARQLFHEAEKASLEHVIALQSAVEAVQALLEDVVEGGGIYAPGLGEFAGRLKEDLFWKSKTLESLAQKQRLRVAGVDR